MSDKIRQFDTGSTRDSGIDPKTGLPKLAYHGFFSARVLKRRAEYMNKHRKQSDGTLRAPDNWKKGIPQSVYLESLTRHVMDLLLLHEGVQGIDLQETLCAISFNSDGFLHEVLREDEEVRDMWNAQEMPEELKLEPPPCVDDLIYVSKGKDPLEKFGGLRVGIDPCGAPYVAEGPCEVEEQMELVYPA